MDAKRDGTSEIWNERYRADSFVYGDLPNEFLRDNALILTPGRTLYLAKGEGRNLRFRVSKVTESPAFGDGSGIAFCRGNSLCRRKV